MGGGVGVGKLRNKRVYVQAFSRNCFVLRFDPKAAFRSVHLSWAFWQVTLFAFAQRVLLCMKSGVGESPMFDEQRNYYATFLDHGISPHMHSRHFLPLEAPETTKAARWKRSVKNKYSAKMETFPYKSFNRRNTFQNRGKGPFVGKLKLSCCAFICNFWHIMCKKTHSLTGTYGF